MKQLTKFEEKQLLYECLFCCRKDRLARQYWYMVHAAVQKLLAQRDFHYSMEDVENLRNDVFARLFEKNCKKLWQYDEHQKCSLPGWILLITSQVVLYELRKNGFDVLTSRQKRVEFDFLKFEKRLDADPDDIEAKFKLIYDTMKKLKPKDSLILKLYYLDEINREKCAEYLHMSVRAFDTAKSRAVQKLKDLVTKQIKRNRV